MASQPFFVSSDGSVDFADVMTWQDALPEQMNGRDDAALVIELADGSTFVIRSALEGAAFRQRMDAYLDETFAQMDALS